MTVALTKPLGAISSLKVYSFPTSKPSILCVLSEEVHVSTTLSPSNTVNLAPSNSDSPVISVLLNSNIVVSF